MIENSVIVVWICIVLQIIRNLIRIVLIKIYRQFRNTGVYQLHATKKTDIALYHHGVHSFYSSTEIHQLCYFTTKIFYTVVVQINTMCCFIIVTAASKSAQCFIRNWLFFKTCSMKCVLKMKIQHKIFNNLIIRIIEQFFND